MNKNTIARALVTGTSVIAVLSVSIASFARPPYLAILKTVYPKADLKCTACHDGGPPKLNEKYGAAVKAVLDKSSDPKVLTVAQIKALDKKGVKPEGVGKKK